MEKEYACGPCKLSRKVSFEMRDHPLVVQKAKELGKTVEELCPELPEFSICPECEQPMELVPEGLSSSSLGKKLTAYHLWYFDLLEKHHGPIEIPSSQSRIDMFGVYAEVEKRRANKVDASNIGT